jgi:hypothetical protein
MVNDTVAVLIAGNRQGLGRIIEGCEDWPSMYPGNRQMDYCARTIRRSTREQAVRWEVSL